MYNNQMEKKIFSQKMRKISIVFFAKNDVIINFFLSKMQFLAERLNGYRDR